MTEGGFYEQKVQLMVIYRPKMTTATRRQRLGYRKGAVVPRASNKLDPWGLRRLAYPIEKRTQAYYSVFQIELPVENLDEFSQDLKVDERILRFMITRGE